MKWKYYLSIIVLLIMNFILIIEIYHQRIKFEKQIDRAYIYNLYFDLLLGNIKMNYYYNNIKIDDFKVIDNKGRKFLFSNLLDDNYKLFLFYSHQNCLSCVDAALKDLVDFSSTIDSDRVAIIGEYSNIRELKAYMNNKNINIPIYFVDENKIPILQKENTPYVFLMKNDLIVNFLFIPIKELRDYFKEYSKIIKERFFYSAEIYQQK